MPQGTVLGPLVFQCHINDLPYCVKFQVRLFADDCLIYRQIKTKKDHKYSKKVQVGKDQEKAQSERDSHSKTEVGKSQTNNQALIP